MKKFAIIIILTMVLLTLLPVSVLVNAEQEIVTGAIDELDFDDYMGLISEIAETEEYPHFLTEYTKRYEEYQELNPDIPFDIVIAYVNVNIDLGHYEDIEPVSDPDKITVLVNKNFSLPADWEPDDFVDIGAGHLMREEAAEAFIKMREAMREANLNLNVVITYRSYARQRGHFSNAVARAGRRSAEAGFARAGHSEHQTGLAVDVLHKAHDGGLMVHMGFENSRQFNWMVENAHEFGFILRYPNGYRNYSGFIYEPWHWRYVGIPVATAMVNEEISLYEEFYGRYLAQGVQDKVNAYIKEQQELAEAAEAAAIAEAKAEAEAAAAAAEAEELAAQAEAELDRIAAEFLTAARKAAEEKIAESNTGILEMPSGNRHFLEGIAALGIIIIIVVLFLVRNKGR